MCARRLFRCSVISAFLGLAALPAVAHDRMMDHRDPLAYPYSDRDPSDPGLGSSSVRYSSVTGDARSYRPVEPLPWGDINKRVTQPESSAAQKPQKQTPQNEPVTPPAEPMPGM